MRGILILTVLGGCSIATVRGPNDAAPNSDPPRCTRDARLPIVVDGMLGLVGIAGGAGGIASEGGKAGTGTYVGGGALIAGGLFATISAIIGYRRQHACEEAWSVFAGVGGR